VLLDPETQKVTHWHRSDGAAPWEYEDRVDDELVLRGCGVRLAVHELFVALPPRG